MSQQSSFSFIVAHTGEKGIPKEGVEYLWVGDNVEQAVYFLIEYYGYDQYHIENTIFHGGKEGVRIYATRVDSPGHYYWTKEIGTRMQECYRQFRDQYMNEFILCGGCKFYFRHSLEDKARFQSMGWKKPRICKLCSEARYNARMVEKFEKFEKLEVCENT